MGVDGAYSPYALAGVFAVRYLRDDCDFGCEQCGESDRWVGWAGDWMHDYCRGGADCADLRQRACCVFGLSGAATDADGERADGLLRVDGGGEYRISLV